MEELFLAVMRQIGDNMPEIRTIDEDYGQLAVGENQDTYPVVFPAALVGNIKIEWATRGSIQMGRGKLMVRLAQDCYDDTHIGSGTEDKIKERHAMHSRLCRCLHGFEPLDEMEALERVSSEDYTLDGPGNIKVFETTFAFEVVDRGVSIPL
jgi:hypothetical protein